MIPIINTDSLSTKDILMLTRRLSALFFSSSKATSFKSNTENILMIYEDMPKVVGH